MLNDRGAILTRTLDDGRVIDLVPMLFGKWRLCVSADARDEAYTDGW